MMVKQRRFIIAIFAMYLFICVVLIDLQGLELCSCYTMLHECCFAVAMLFLFQKHHIASGLLYYLCGMHGLKTPKEARLMDMHAKINLKD